MGKLPDYRKVKPGQEVTIITKGKGGKRKVTFVRTKKKEGFGVWKITESKKIR